MSRIIITRAPHLWIPRVKILEARDPISQIIGMCGFFKFEAIRPDGRRRLLVDWFPNLITDVGLNAIGTVANWTTQCRVGTGNATPTVLDTSLQTQVAVNTGIVSGPLSDAQSSPPYYGSAVTVYRFNAGVAAGNLAEVGVGVPSSTLFSRALILDTSGSPTVPTTITVLSDEILDVTYQIRAYPALDDVLGTISISGENYGYTLRAAQVTSDSHWGRMPAVGAGGTTNSMIVYSGNIGAITSGPSGTSAGATPVAAAYSNLSLRRDTTGTWQIGVANFGSPGINSASVNFGAAGSSCMGSFQAQFDHAIPKTSSQVLALTFRHSWGRAVI